MTRSRFTRRGLARRLRAAERKKRDRQAEGGSPHHPIIPSPWPSLPISG
jgi:hypothetical protein